MAMRNSSSEAEEILRELKIKAPDIWESSNGCPILPLTLGELYTPKYTRYLKRRLRILNQYIGMLNAGLITEKEYESKKAEILLNAKSREFNHERVPFFKP